MESNFSHKNGANKRRLGRLKNSPLKKRHFSYDDRACNEMDILLSDASEEYNEPCEQSLFSATISIVKRDDLSSSDEVRL